MFDAEALRNWFLAEKRDLPWRDNPTPYRVWVSEMMLQQTQAAVVIPYFEKWMERFPSINHLASASLEEVIKLWEGLGYYSRARYLHAGAKYLVEHHQGLFSSDKMALQNIKGLGKYTLGAIQSFAFKQKAAAVDGNVIRVLTRYFKITSDTSLVKTQKEIWLLAESLLPDKEPWVITEGLIELGALICTKKPRCNLCPLNSTCKSYGKKESETLPFKTKKTKSEQLHRTVAIIQHQDEVILQKGPPGKLMADLYEFPYIVTSPEDLVWEQIQKLIGFDCAFSLRKTWPQTSQSFTRFRVTLQPIHFTIKDKKVVREPYLWYPISRLNELPFSSGHKKILSNLIKI